MGKVAFVFPGQGAQYVGMGKALEEAFPYTRAFFDEASEVLGFDLRRLCLEGPEEELRRTENTQPAILTVCAQALKVLEREVGLKPDLLAGHSLGEYTALFATGALSFRDVVRVVRERGKAMEEACPRGQGAMAAILGLEGPKVEELCKRARKDQEVLVPANYNCPGQVVISGHLEAVKRAVELSKEMGAKRAVLLDVSGPFHSPFMEKAAERLREVLEEIEWSAFSVPVVSNVTAEPYASPEEAKKLLVLQVKSPVRWEESVRRMVALGVDTFIELGPNKVLSGLIRRTVEGVVTLNLEGPQDLDTLNKAFGKN